MKQFGLFLLIVIVGMLGVSIYYHSVQIDPPGKVTDLFMPGHELNEAHKMLITTQSSLSKWLMGVAYGVLIGVFTLKYLKENQSDPVQGAVVVLGSAFMVISLYCGFLYFEGTAHAIAKGPMSDLYRPRVTSPLRLQFYSLLIGVLLFASRFLFKVFLIGMVIGFFPVETHTYAQSQMEPSADKNILEQEFYQYLDKMYGVELDSQSRAALTEVTYTLLGKSLADLEPEDVRLFAEILVSTAQFIAHEDENWTTAKIIRALQTQNNSSGINPSDLLQGLEFDLDFWNKKTGALRIVSEIGRVEVLLDERKIGITNCVFRLETERIWLQFVKDGEFLPEYETWVTIERDKIKEIKLEKKE